MDQTLEDPTGHYDCGHCGTRTPARVVLNRSDEDIATGRTTHVRLVLRCDACGSLSVLEGLNRFPAYFTRTTDRLEVDELPHPVDLVWDEVRKCDGASAPLATAAMLRTLIIAIWRDINGEPQKRLTFEGALDALQESEDLTRRLRTRADTLRLLGNDAVHEVVVPESEQLDAALTTAELWLRVLYEDVPHEEPDVASEQDGSASS
jgi:hypothetical protein